MIKDMKIYDKYIADILVAGILFTFPQGDNSTSLGLHNIRPQ
jgi:hypothetical protein